MHVSPRPTTQSRAFPLPWMTLAEPPVSTAGTAAVQLAAFRQPPACVPEHVAPVHVLCINTGRSTRFEQCVDGHESGGVCRHGRASFYPTGLSQSFRWRDPADFLLVGLDPAVVRAVGSETLGIPEPHPMPTDLGDDRLLAELAASLLDSGADRVESDVPPRGGTSRFDRLAAALIAHLVHRHFVCGTSSDSRAGEHAPCVRPASGPLGRVIDHIEERLHEPLPVAQLAGLVHLSVPHFARRFRAATGLSPHRYIVHQRVIRAEQLLRASSLSVSRVAESTGFSDQSHLSRHFRRRFGLSPDAYRRDRSIRSRE